MTTPSAIDYTSRDYAGLRQSMLAFARTVAPEWSGARTGDPNDFGVALLEVFAYEGDILSYYGDRIANESFLSTATQRGSVLAHAALLDYTPRSASASSTVLSFTVISDVDLVIPAGFEVQTTADGINDQTSFETDADLFIPASATGVTLSVAATQGNVVTDEVVATSCGDLDAAYPLAESPVVASSLQVRVVETVGGDGQVWFPVTNLLDARANDLAYAISMDENEALTIHFGDGVNGRVPPRGSVIHAAYRVGGGAAGNVLVNSITEITDPGDLVFLPPIDPLTGLRDESAPPVEPTAPVVMSVTNQQEASGGADAEGLESIRVNAPRALRTHGRAITLEDFEALALTVPGVQIAKAKAVATVYTNVTLYIAPPGGTQPTPATLNAVVDYMRHRKLANVTVVAANPQYVSIDVGLDIAVDNRFSQLAVRQAVNNSLTDLLAFENVSFGGRVSLSSIYNAVSGVQGVSSVVVSKLARNRGVGVSDIILKDNELPISGSFSLLATGGVVNSAGSEGDVVGEGTGTPPTASGAPVIGLLRCDPNSTHVELVWTAGANTDAWDVVISYRDASGAEVERTVIGPYLTPTATLDLPLIGAGRAASIVFSTEAYHGGIGPVTSPQTSSPYLCEGPTRVPAPTPVGETLAPPPPNAPSFLSFAGDSESVTFTATATTTDGTTATLIYKEIVRNAAGAILYTSTVGQAPPGQALTVSQRALSNAYGGVPAFYEVQAADIRYGNYGPSSAQQPLPAHVANPGGGGSTPAGTPGAPVIFNKSKTGPVSSQYTYQFDVTTNLQAPVDQVAIMVEWHFPGSGGGWYSADTVIVNNPGTGSQTFHYSQQYSQGDLDMVRVTISERAAGHTDTYSAPVTVNFP